MKSEVDFNNIKINNSIGEKSDIYDENKIDEILENITLNRPKQPFSQFCTVEYERLKKLGVKIELKSIMKDLAKSWSELKETEKKKYNQLYENEKKEYIKSLKIVGHFLFKDYNGVIRKPATAYQIFLNERLIEGIDKNLESKQIKKDASNAWKLMSKDQKQKYKDKKKENENWFEKAKNIQKITPISVFIQKEISLAREKKQELPNVLELSNKWKTMKYSDKYKYLKYAEEINLEREKLYDIYEMINGIKPKKPVGAFRIFLQEKAKDNILNSIKDGYELWTRLTDDEKEEYRKKSHKLVLAYKYKKMIYEKKIKKILPKKPLNAFFIFIKDKKGQKIPKGQTVISYWRPYFNNLPKNEKEKYEKKEKLEKEKYEKKMEKFKNAVFDIPHKPLTPFRLYIKETIPNLKENKEYKNLSTPELVKLASSIWIKSETDLKKKYENIAKEDKKRFKIEMKQFEKFGYYLKKINNENNFQDKKELKNEEDNEAEQVNTKRRIKKKRSVISKKTNKGYKKTKSIKKNNNIRKRK